MERDYIGEITGLDYNVSIQVPHLEFPDKSIFIFASGNDEAYEMLFAMSDNDKVYKITGGKDVMTFYNWALSASTIKEIYRLHALGDGSE